MPGVLEKIILFEPHSNPLRYSGLFFFHLLVKKLELRKGGGFSERHCGTEQGWCSGPVLCHFQDKSLLGVATEVKTMGPCTIVATLYQSTTWFN